jgi:hypothetical protein
LLRIEVADVLFIHEDVHERSRPIVLVEYFVADRGEHFSEDGHQMMHIDRLRELKIDLSPRVPSKMAGEVYPDRQSHHPMSHASS